MTHHTSPQHISHRLAQLARCAAFCTTLTLLGADARAQMVVNDPINTAENAASAIADAKQLIWQIKGHYNDLQQIRMQLQNLKKLSARDLDSLTRSMTQIEVLLRQGRRISYRWGAIDQQFDRLYGRFRPNEHRGTAYQQRRTSWEQETDTALLTVMRAHGLVATQNATLAAGFDRLKTKSRSAEGALSAIQAGNEMLSIMLTQQKALSELILLDSRAQQTRIIEARRKEQAAEARRAEALGGMGKRRRIPPAVSVGVRR